MPVAGLFSFDMLRLPRIFIESVWGLPGILKMLTTMMTPLPLKFELTSHFSWVDIQMAVGLLVHSETKVHFTSIISLPFSWWYSPSFSFPREGCSSFPFQPENIISPSCSNFSALITCPMFMIHFSSVSKRVTDDLSWWGLARDVRCRSVADEEPLRHWLFTAMPIWACLISSALLYRHLSPMMMRRTRHSLPPLLFCALIFPSSFFM